jgi:hypothetical protein
VNSSASTEMANAAYDMTSIIRVAS